MSNFYRVLFPVIALCLFLSCEKKESGFEILSFNAITNEEFKSADTIVNIEADLSDAPLRGIRIPTASQCKGGKIAFDFKIKRTGNKKERLFYVLYYQNETYKLPENDLYSDENFYGTWETDSILFREIPAFEDETTVRDSLTIVGNPRNESIYYGENPAYKIIGKTELNNTIAYIKDDKAWYAEILKKAIAENRAVEEQLEKDATWAIKEQRRKEGIRNNRLWRNPRMGKYEFMLVVVTANELRKLPFHIKVGGYKNESGKYVNPFYYFKMGEGSESQNIVYAMGSRKLKTKAVFNLGSGIYVDRKRAGRDSLNESYYTSNCGEAEREFRYAQFEQYFHYINKDFPLKNVPLIEDVMDPSFTRQKYEEIRKSYEHTNKFVNTYVNSSDCPCKTVISDSVNKTVTIINPGNKEGEYKKEHVGIIGRIGFTYGKWRAKIKFPELINRHNVWVGLTNAFWLLAEDGGSPWNQRRECKATVAYIPKSAPDNKIAYDMSKRTDGYSEIDFEILKESQYWPATSYPGKKSGPTENAALSDDIMVTCTNWDLACHQPINFDIGARENIIDGMKFVHHRWDGFYKALTTKCPEKNQELFGGDYYYFEIEWKPNKIIWRIGPSKDKMRIVCIMDDTISAIPNNQMVAVVTQEWHSQEWWPTAPFKQNYIPFPKKDIVGKILEIEVE